MELISNDCVKRVNFQFQFDKIKSGHVLIYAKYIFLAPILPQNINISVFPNSGSYCLLSGL